MRRALVLVLGTALCSLTVGQALAADAAGKVKAGSRHVAAVAAAAKVADPTIRQPGWTMKNAMGQPDLSGYWSNATLTPVTRNPRLTDKPMISLAEARQLEKVWAKALEDSDKPTDPGVSTQAVQDAAAKSELFKIRPDFAAAGGDTGGYNTFWIDPGAHIMEVNGEYRTSILTTANGQAPPRKDGTKPSFFGGGARESYDSYETRGLGERCIMGFGRNAGPPMLANGYYNNDYYIIQSPDAVAIQVELVHDTRIVPLKASHRTDGVRPWMGDSIGHYEGETLVVETTNIPQGQAFFGSWKNLKVTEWFTRVSPTRLNYRFEVSDPDTWATAWGGEYNFAPLKGIVYEYACHEGNYALPAILAGARRQEQDAAAAAKGKPGGAE